MNWIVRQAGSAGRDGGGATDQLYTRLCCAPAPYIITEKEVDQAVKIVGKILSKVK